MFPTWLFRPRRVAQFRTPVRAENYRICCSVVPTKPMFRFFHYIHLLVILLALTYLIVNRFVFTNPNERLNNYFTKWLIILIYVSITSVIGIISAHCHKPIFIQIHWILMSFYLFPSLVISLFLASISFLSFIPHIGEFFMRAFSDSVGINIRPQKQEDVLKIFIFMTFAAVTFILQLLLSSSYFQYIKERQLEIEMNEAELENGSPLRKKDSEKYKILSMN
ncbi:unnamed protein product, partial [Mesorhabditis belari]|uniref:Uncharacterized protein n=1 Tax=Mesorhabditis belari TaxID=2138241 RepID=A0AAF3FJA0_9BILA